MELFYFFIDKWNINAFHTLKLLCDKNKKKTRAKWSSTVSLMGNRASKEFSIGGCLWMFLGNVDMDVREDILLWCYCCVQRFRPPALFDHGVTSLWRWGHFSHRIKETDTLSSTGDGRCYAQWEWRFRMRRATERVRYEGKLRKKAINTAHHSSAAVIERALQQRRKRKNAYFRVWMQIWI